MSVKWAMGDTMAILPQYRNIGVGTALFKERIKILKSRGIDFISSIVQENASRARRFWRKNGFKEGVKLIWLEKNI